MRRILRLFVIVMAAPIFVCIAPYVGGSTT